MSEGIAIRVPRNARIDCLRGIAISAVLVLHYALAYKVQQSPFIEWFSLTTLRHVFLNGNYGVTMFFVISGYLITQMSLRRFGALSQVDIRQFYLYRFARIMPSLVLALLVIVALGCLGLPHFTNTDGGHHLPSSYFAIAVLSVLTFWHNVLMQIEGWFNYCLNIYWSLSVEEVFYLAFPLLAVGLRRRGWLVAVAALLVVFGPVYRAIHLYHGVHPDEELYWECGYFACFDAIALGCLTALLAQARPMRSGQHVLRVVAGAGLVVVYFSGISGHEVFGFTLVALMTALILWASAQDTQPGLMTGRMTAGLRWLGRHSYELYLFHIIVLALMRNVIERGHLPQAMWLPWLGVFVALSVALAFLVARWVSEPANRYLRQGSKNRPVEQVGSVMES